MFDSLSRRVNLIDSVGNKTTFVYDALGREIEPEWAASVAGADQVAAWKPPLR